MSQSITNMIIKRLDWLETSKKLKLEISRAAKVCEAVSATLEEYIETVTVMFNDRKLGREESERLTRLERLQQKISITVALLTEELKKDCASREIWLFGDKVLRKSAEKDLKEMIKSVLKISILAEKADHHCAALEETVTQCRR